MLYSEIAVDEFEELSIRPVEGPLLSPMEEKRGRGSWHHL